MLEWQLPLYATLISKIALIEGMKADNELRKMRNDYPAYCEEDFAGIAIECEKLSKKMEP